jgi:hypothetical protein
MTMCKCGTFYNSLISLTFTEHFHKYSVPSENEYQEHFLGVKAAGA